MTSGETSTATPGSVEQDGEDGLAWHYTNGAGLISILSSHTLWATASAFLNDRHEIVLGGRRISERVLSAAARRGETLAREVADRVSASTQQGEGPGRGSLFILSASRSPDSLSMWRLYGGAQESYAVGIDQTQPLAVLARSEADAAATAQGDYFLRRQGWRRVRYDAAEQDTLVDTALQHLDGLVSALPPHDLTGPRTQQPAGPPGLEVEALIEPFLQALQEALLLIKHPGFVDEQEFRYAVALAGGVGGSSLEARLLSYRSTAYGIAPYLRLTGAEPGGAPIAATPVPLPLRGVAVSPSPNGDEALASLRQLLLAHGYDVPVRRSSIPFRG